MKAAQEGVYMLAEIILSADTQFIAVAEIPSLIAKALHPEPRSNERTVSQFCKDAKPGAIGETAKWDGWPIEDDDRKALERAWVNLPPLPERLTEEVVRPYLDAANAPSVGLDWELGVLWTNPELNAEILRLATEREHRKALVSAIRFGKIRAFSSTTRLQTTEYDGSAIVRLSEFISYAALFDISIKTVANKTVADESKREPSAISSGTEAWKEAARRIADEHFDRDTANNCRDSLANYSERTMKTMQERKVHGPRGRIVNPKTVQREALQGDKWWQGKKK